MNPSDKPWQKLVAAARKAPEPSPSDEAAPFGFSARVAALAFSQQAPPSSVFARFSLKAAAFACVLALGAVAANYTAIKGAFDDSTQLAGDDPIGEVVDMGS
ncbi:MAG TPA: hypothetical protein VIJ19_11760 [Opitutaceae bacterium]